MTLTTKATISSFGGRLLKLSHPSKECACEMSFHLWLPSSTKSTSSKAPLLIYLAGLTCTPDNGAEKAFLQHSASELGIALLFPDTSPRGLGYEGEDKDYDFGSAAGFYIDATREPWKKGYRMESYVTGELLETVGKEFGEEIDTEKVGICGHSMGGHGALSLFLKYPGKFKSVSAFAPIANPTACPWGKKAFAGYLGEDNKEKWADHDATELVKKWSGESLDVLIDVGTADNFYKQGQLLPENFVKAAEGKGKVDLRVHDGYDHSYFFMSSFADDHVKHAAKYLSAEH